MVAVQEARAAVREALPDDFGLQVEMGLAGLIMGAAAARLDTGELSPHFSEMEYLEEGKQLHLWGSPEKRKERRGYHARLTRLLRSMETGEHGLVAKAVAVKYRHDVERCPGVVRNHKVCGRNSFYPTKCSFALCPWCQHRRADKNRRKLVSVVDLLSEPKLLTLSPPNLADLGPGAVAAFSKIFTRLLRRAVMKKVRGGVRSIEITYGRNGWNLHMHCLMGSPWIAQYPVWDIKFTAGRWVVVKKHLGLAREFTKVCQSFEALRSPRLDFDLDCPEHWYFIDIRQADNYGSVAEVMKYIAKGSEIVNGGSGVVVDYLLAIKGRRMIQGFGSLYNVNLEGLDDWGNEFDVSAAGECPYEDCPGPAVHDWQFVGFGPGDCQLDRDNRTGSYRIVGLARDGPG